MTQKNPTRLRRSVPLLAVAAATCGLVATSLPASGQSLPNPFEGVAPFDEYGFQGEGHARVQHADNRTGTVAPSAEQRRAAEALGATAARFNAFGTPKVLMNHKGVLSGPREGAAVDIARSFVRENAALFRLDAARVDALEVLRDAPLRESTDLRRQALGLEPVQDDVAHAVLFRQRFGDLAAGRDGLLTVGVKADGSVAYVTSSVTGDSALEGAQELDAVAAIQAAAKDVEFDVGTLTAAPGAIDERFLSFASSVATEPQLARLVALPTPTDGVRRAWEVSLMDNALDEHGNPTGFISFIDAETGKVWQRENRVEHFATGPGAPAASSMSIGRVAQESPSAPSQWRVFPGNPPFVHNADTSDDNTDTRVLWCWDNLSNPEECVEEQRNPASPNPWDQTGSRPTFTTDGNNASSAISEASFLTPDTAANRPVSPTREYDYPWENSWFNDKCDPTNFGTVVDDRNDEAASTTNLFVMHNRMHDWSYYLGFTEENYNMQVENFGKGGVEGDPELGSSQAGRRTSSGRDNANQRTMQDGIAPITNQYLWQPLAGLFYAPCVDGAYDMAVVAHEYGHAISNRMIAGPDGGTGDTQGQSESWSDLLFAAYFQEFAISSGEGVDPVVLGPYVTGNDESGIRNYGMNNSPLTYGELEYDGNGLTSPHANGEIWSAANYDIFTAMAQKYDATHPSSDAALQRSCAMGEKDAKDCPGNRRWNQMQFDSFLLMPQDASMVDSRDAMLAADMMRFGGANQDLMWDAFAKRGLGESAASFAADQDGTLDAVPGFDSPLRTDEARVTFRAPAGVADMEVFVGTYEARAVPIADTIAGNTLADTASFVPGTYSMLARAPGFGVQRFSLELAGGQSRAVEVPMRRNHASATHGAEASGDGVNLPQILDDTEATNWASRESAGTASEGKGEGAQVEGRQVTVDLAGDAPVTVSEVQVSAALNGGCTQDLITGACEDADVPSEDPGSQNRFSALRSFDVFTCNAASGADCTTDEGFTQVFTSADDAFPGVRPRPKVKNLTTKPFDVTDSQATHVRLVVRDNQCTGGPDYQLETNEDNDPNFNPDCDTEAASPDRNAPVGPGGTVVDPPKEIVRAAEIQVFSAPAGAPREVGGSTLTPEARTITDACPEGEGGVPRNSRQDDNGNVHEFAIDCMVWYEIAKGTSETAYEPGKPVSRGQMASFIARLIEQSGGSLDEGDDAFTDDNGSTHEANINKLAAAGIVAGKSEGVYDPNGVVTRAQMAKFLVEGYQFRSGNLLAGSGDYFADDDGSVHEGNINRAAAAGFTGGRGAGYEPGADVLRDQMASFLARTLDLLVEEGTATAKGSTPEE